ncbi:hypothetical protein ACNKHQ_11460 [Shigella flexneri]
MHLTCSGGRYSGAVDEALRHDAMLRIATFGGRAAGGAGGADPKC